MQILFYDVPTPIAYTDTTLQLQAMGGTEATIIRIAHSLKHYHTIYIAQYCRNTIDNQISNGVHYISFESANNLSPNVVVLLRDKQWLDEIAKRFPHARRFFWLHNMPSRDLPKKYSTLLNEQYEIIAVSHFHRQSIEGRLKGKWYQRIFRTSAKKSKIPIHVIYNPIDDNLKPDNTNWNPDQMISMSTPHKGLARTLELFKQVINKFPNYYLLIASHSKLDKGIKFPKQTRILGAIPHHQVIQHVRKSFCVFYPQHLRKETFGLVYAESNAVGTPVLAHDLGAAREVLSDPTQLIDGRKASAVIDKISQWHKNRPSFEARPEFRLSKVTKDWLELLKE